MELHLEQIPDLRPSGCLHKTPARKVLRRFAILLHCQTREEQRERERERVVGVGRGVSGWGRGRLLLNGPVWDQSYLQGSKRMIITGNYCINCLSPQRGT